MTELTSAKRIVQRILNTAVNAEIARHPKKGAKRVMAELTSAHVAVEAPYAREWRGILGALAERATVAAVATPRFGAGEYRRGADVTLYGLKRDVRKVVDDYEKIRAELTATLKTTAGEPGEDVATFRTSWLLGYRLGLVSPSLDDTQVRDTVVGRTIRGGVAWKSTGSGAVAGYRAATGAPTAAELEAVSA